MSDLIPPALLEHHPVHHYDDSDRIDLIEGHIGTLKTMLRRAADRIEELEAELLDQRMMYRDLVARCNQVWEEIKSPAWLRDPSRPTTDKEPTPGSES